MIKINEFIEETCELYNAKDEWMGTIIGESALIDVRCQISEQRLNG